MKEDRNIFLQILKQQKGLGIYYIEMWIKISRF